MRTRCSVLEVVARGAGSCAHGALPAGSYCDPLLLLACILAAAVHDLEHPGLTVRAHALAWPLVCALGLHSQQLGLLKSSVGSTLLSVPVINQACWPLSCLPHWLRSSLHVQNDFLVAVGHPLAMVYNDQSPAGGHLYVHAACCKAAC
jgi:hypothetical protein